MTATTDLLSLQSGLPKAELHLHVEGTLEPDLVFRLARRNGVRLRFASPQELAAAYRFTSLQSFLDIYYENMAVLQRAEDFTELADAYLARVRDQGVRHAEIFFDPQAHRDRGVPAQALIEGLSAALSASLDRFGISTGLILCFLRDRGSEAAMDCLREFLPYRDHLLGVGLDSAEVGHPPSAFREVFSIARSEGLHAVAHAGEEGPPSYIREALDDLGVERIDHGVRCLEDPDLVRRLRDEAIPLTVCPMSNLRLQVFGSWAQYPFQRLLGENLTVTVNSDDPAYFGGYVGDNYVALHQHAGLGLADARQIAAASFEASFASDARRAACLAELAERC